MDLILAIVIIVLSFVVGFLIATIVASRAFKRDVDGYNLLSKEFTDLTNRYVLLQTEVMKVRDNHGDDQAGSGERWDTGSIQVHPDVSPNDAQNPPPTDRRRSKTRRRHEDL